MTIYFYLIIITLKLYIPILLQMLKQDKISKVSISPILSIKQHNETIIDYFN
ncbi:hypothetical protein BACI71_90398 [Bacillus mycoides]|uniref:Uncharacterized protein n=1 Tax=Bacillus mycoides TaxID=1405 RepID=A0A654CEL3_BACMY|nr:hypothetical protein BACI71_90398 [Bacillus mycoides]